MIADMPRVTLLTPYLLVAAVHLVAALHGPDALADLTQVLLMPALAAYLLLVAPRQHRLVRLAGAALFFSWLGDTVPRFLSEDAGFPALIGCFLLGQGCYIAGFWPYRHRSVLRTRLVTPYAVCLVVLWALLLPHAGMLAPAVVVYGASLAGMAVLATGIDRLAWAGGAVFVVSDGLIALDAFEVWTQPGHDFWVMLTYILAQLLIVLGVTARAASVGSSHDEPRPHGTDLRADQPRSRLAG
ncbi:lysoplasmalogenase [Nocardioides sp.]|uniref:lysoplasmalogenase n=1 Tax=Nocardioides sp. TaxID=35761 RepID=UPI0039E44C6A